jgi:hypothetical protein
MKDSRIGVPVRSMWDRDEDGQAGNEPDGGPALAQAGEVSGVR